MATEKKLVSIQIDGVNYALQPIPPHLSPFNHIIGKLLKEDPKTFDDAARISAEIEKSLGKLLQECASPTPKKEHQLAVFNAIISLTNETINDAEKFRKHGRSNTAKSSRDVPADPQETDATFGLHNGA